MALVSAVHPSPSELIVLGENRYLVWGSAPDASVLDARPVPEVHARQVLRAAFRSRSDVRARVLNLFRERTGAPPAHTGVAVYERDLESALQWALAEFDRSPLRLHVLERVLPRIEAHFTPQVPPPPKPRETPVPDTLHHLEFEVLDQSGDAHVGVP